MESLRGNDPELTVRKPRLTILWESFEEEGTDIIVPPTIARATGIAMQQFIAPNFTRIANDLYALRGDPTLAPFWDDSYLSEVNSGFKETNAVLNSLQMSRRVMVKTVPGGYRLGFSEDIRTEEDPFETSSTIFLAGWPLNNFLNALKHEIRTPFSPTIGYSRIIYRKTNDPRLEAIYRSATSANNLLNLILGSQGLVINTDNNRNARIGIFLPDGNSI